MLLVLFEKQEHNGDMLMRIGATLARQNKHTATKANAPGGRAAATKSHPTCQGEILEYDDGRITSVTRMTTIEIHNDSDSSSLEMTAFPEWFDQLGDSLTPNQLLIAMQHAHELENWVKKRLPERHHRYALGLEPSPGLSRALAKKIAELERRS